MADDMLTAVQVILFQEWDPIGVKHNSDCRDEYDSHAPTILKMLRCGADEYKLAHHLFELERVSMGLTRTGVNDSHRRIAKRLLELVD